MDELFSERLILREPGSGTRKILERELMQCGYTVEAFRSNVCISSFKLIRHLVSEGCGVSFLYEAVVKNDAQFGHFSCPPLTGCAIMRGIERYDCGLWNQPMEKSNIFL